MVDMIHIDRIALPADIKHVTRRKILEVFKDGEIKTAVDVHGATGISKPTIMKTIQFFCSVGVLASAGLGQTSSVGGKKPERFVFANHRKILCITLWPNGITLALSALIGDIYGLTRFPYSASDSLEEIFQHLGEVAGEFLQTQGVSPTEIYGIELSTSGTVDYKNGILRYNSQSPGWGRNISLIDYLKPIFGQNIAYFIENAGKATGRAVMLEHPEFADRRILSIFTTWGISACLIENGHVLNGKDSLIGEIGHMTILNTDQETCGCGKHGCLERLICIERIRKLLQEQGVESFDGVSPVTFETLFVASRQHHPQARLAVRYLAHCFAIALHNLSLVYNPSDVVFQGDLAYADEYFDQCLLGELKEFRYYPAEGVFSTHYDRGDLAALAARGGASLLKRHFFSTMEEA